MALTKFKNAITVLTEQFSNSLYGGLYGTPEGDELDEDDPLVAGHVHDGIRNQDGHAQKINLQNHVVGQLDGANIQDNSISEDKLDFEITTPTASPYLQVFANETERLDDDTVYDAGDLYSKALQLDTMKEYVLTDISPITWTALNTEGESVAQERFTLVMENDFPLEQGLTEITITFPEAPVDLIVKQFVVSVLDVDSTFDKSEFNVGSALTLVSNVTVNGVPIDCVGKIPIQLYTEDAEIPIEINIPLQAGDVLEFDVLFILSSLSSISLIYVEDTITTPTPNYFIGNVAGSATITGPIVQATNTLTVASSPTDSSERIDFSQRFFKPTTVNGLIPANGARTSGDNDYNNTLGTPTLIAADIVAAINDNANDFEGVVSASNVGNVITLEAVFAGPIGNQLTVDSDVPEITAGSLFFSGGVMASPTVVTLVAAPISGTIKYAYVSNFLSGGGIPFYYFTLEALKINGGANLLTSQITANLMQISSNKNNPLLDIPIEAGDIITLEINKYLPGSSLILSPIVIIQPD